MNHLSLFSGIGGFDLAAQWAGWQNIAHVEQNEFCLKVLKYYWPNAKTHTDVKKTDFTIYRGSTDILTGGFPCQPFSHAGNRKGTNDARYLWPEMCRAIKEAEPRYVIAENVTGIASMVFPARGVKVDSQNTIEGKEHHRTMEAETVLHRVCTDLQQLGYSVQPVIIPAAALNAPHRRDRVWFIAVKDTNQNGWRSSKRQKETNQRKQRNARAGNFKRIPTRYGFATNATSYGYDGNKTQKNKRKRAHNIQPRPQWIRTTKRSGAERFTANTCQFQPQRCKQYRSIKKKGQIQKQSRQFSRSICDFWQNFPTKPPVCAGNDGLPNQLHRITFSKWRKESLKAAGNAIVPQVAYEIFKAINELETKQN